MSDYTTFYQTLAEGMNEMLVSIDGNLDAIDKNVELLTYMLNLTTDEDFDVNRALRNVGAVMLADVYQGLIIIPESRYKVSLGAFALNEYTKRYINSDLTDFVNNEVWNGNCVPYEWAVVSENKGEDISGWNVCESS